MGSISVWIDHDEDIQALIQKIQGLSDFQAGFQLSERVQFIPLIVDHVPPPAERATPLKERIEREVRRVLNDGVDLVLVDLAYGVEKDPGAVEIGWEIATHLQDKMFPMPIGVYTQGDLSPRHRALISAAGLSLVLEDFRKMVRGEPLTCQNWFDVFSGVVKRAKENTSRFPKFNATSGSSPTIQWADGHPKAKSPAFKQYAPPLAQLALQKVHGAKSITLSQMGGGFSGSFLIKATLPDRTKAYVIKIDESPNRLQREFEGYEKVRAYLNRDYFIQPESDPISLTPEMWGAFAIEYDAKRRPLVDCNLLESGGMESLYRALWTQCLFSLYGTTAPQELKLRAILKPTARQLASDASEALSRYSEKVRSCSPEVQIAFDCANGWLSGKNEYFASDTSISVPWVERIHGDLNCRNIFYDSDNSSFLLIDFPNVQPTALATDFAKAEAELILILMDRATGCDCDFSRLQEWAEMTRIFSEGVVPKCEPAKDKELERVRLPLTALRELYAERAAANGDVAEAYRLCLIARLLPYIGYPDITPAKKCLALVWLGQLLSTEHIKHSA